MRYSNYKRVSVLESSQISIEDESDEGEFSVALGQSVLDVTFPGVEVNRTELLNGVLDYKAQKTVVLPRIETTRPRRH